MASRQSDVLEVEAEGLGVLDAFTSFDLTLDMTSPCEAAFEVGDDATWDALLSSWAPGQKYRTRVNGCLMHTGRVVLDDLPVDSSSGAVTRFTVRSLTHEAYYASADPDISVKDATLLDVVLAAYAPLGLTKADFIFNADLARNLMTGKTRSSGKAEADLTAMKLDQARVNPPETIYQFVDRHLRRFGIIHWDSPDGRIVVSAPNDDVDSIFRFDLFNGAEGRINNVLHAEWVRDLSQVPTVLGVFGEGGKAGFRKSKVRAIITDGDAVAAQFYRPVLIIADGVKTQAQAERAAAREMSARRKNKDVWTMTVDGLSYWDGSSLTPYAIDAPCTVSCGLAAGPNGGYYCPKLAMHLTVADGFTTDLTLIRRGVWVV